MLFVCTWIVICLQSALNCHTLWISTIRYWLF